MTYTIVGGFCNNAIIQKLRGKINTCAIVWPQVTGMAGCMPEPILSRLLAPLTSANPVMKTIFLTGRRPASGNGPAIFR